MRYHGFLFPDIYSKPLWAWTLFTTSYIAWSLEIKPVLKCQQGSSFICEVGFSSQNTTGLSWEKNKQWNWTEWNHSRIAFWRASVYISLKHARLWLERESILSCMWCAVFHFHRESSGDWLYHSLLVIVIHWDNKSILAFSCQSKQNLLPIQKKNSEYDQMIGNDVVWCQS